MSDSGKDHTSPSVVDGDGVRITREHSPRLLWALALRLLALVIVAAGFGYLVYPTQSKPMQSSNPTNTGGAVATAPDFAGAKKQTTDEDQVMTRPRVLPPHSARAPSNPADLTTGDANDIATYISPSQPEPTMAELIQALRDSGDQGGIAAFNPPGTNPPLRGLAVPEDFALPDGYVRHHQVTDDGQPIEPILMFAPDYVLRDASGQPIAIPEDRVVPPQLAPPGLELRPITIPPPPPPE